MTQKSVVLILVDRDVWLNEVAHTEFSSKSSSGFGRKSRRGRVGQR